jgi:hypothetical protein
MQITSSSRSIPTDKFLTIAVNLLNRSILEANRAAARRIFRQLEQGKDVPITHLQMEDKTLVRVDIALDHSRYQGEISFAAFRTGLSLLLANAAEALRNAQDIKTYRSEHDPNSILFGFVAVTTENNKPSVMVLGSETGSGEPVIRLCLSYLDNVQFEDQLGAAGSAEV